jgi:hypothetical protein
MVIVAIGASASFGILGSSKGPLLAAQPTPACSPDDSSGACLAERYCALPDGHEVVFYLRDEAARSEVEALRLELEASSDVSRVVFTTKREAYREFEALYPGEPELYETIDPSDLPASLRVQAVDAAAARRVAAIDRLVVDEVRSSGGMRERFCPRDPVPSPQPPSPDETSLSEDARRELRPFDADLLRAECRTDTPDGSVELTDGRKWCRFVLLVDNNTPGPLELDMESQRLRATDGTVFFPWEGGMGGALATRLFDGPLAPNERVMGQVVFLLGPDAAPGALELTVVSDAAPVTLPLDYDCSPDLRLEPDGRCFFASAGDLDASLRAAECRLDPPASVETESDPSVKWCSFEVGIENVSSDPLHFDWDARLLLVGDGEERTYSTAMFTGRLSPRRIDLLIGPRERMIQDLHFEVDVDEIPIDLTIPYEGGRLTFQLNYDCARDLREEPYGRCELEERRPEG